MPVHVDRDKDGCFAQWGASGKKYYFACGDDAEEGRAVKQAEAQGVAVSLQTGEYAQVDEFARLRDVPVFRAGTHNGQAFSDADLDEIVASSNACHAFIQQSIDAGAYANNPQIVLTKPIPGVVNLNHQHLLPETFREAVKGASLTLATKVIGGVKWIVATIDGLKSDIAHYLASRHPYRSVEIIPLLNNPQDGQTYRNVIRSVGFLSPDMPPAVGGQLPHLTAEYAEQGIVCAISEFDDRQAESKTITNHAEETMQDEKQVKQPETVSVQAFMDMQELVATLQNQLAAMQKTLDEAMSEKAEMASEKDKLAAEKDAMIEEKKVMEKALQQQEIDAFCANLAHEFHASPAFIELARPLILAADPAMIMEFAGAQITHRAAMQQALQQVIGLVAKNAVIVPVGEYAKADAPATPDQPKLTETEKQQIAVASYMQAAKAKAKNPNDEKEVYIQAVNMAIANNWQAAA